MSLENLTDEEVLREFVKRFKVDGAILVYCEDGHEYGFARWRNGKGRKWANEILKVFKTR